MNWYVFFVSLIPLLYITWIKLCPLQAVAFAAELKRRFRLFVIRREGQNAAKLLEHMLRKKAGNNARSQKAITILMAQESARIIEKFGTFVANQWLGTPGPLERDF